MLASAASLLIPLALTTSFGSPSPPLHEDVRAFVTGYNTVTAQTSPHPCIAASGADICGRRDAVACPRRISLGTIVEIRGTTYVCEDRLAKKYDSRFDISCDKDMACPPGVTGWTTVKVYEAAHRSAAPAEHTNVADSGRSRRVAARPRALAHVVSKAVSVAANTVVVLRTRG